jgi:NitT/TauT family transport system substrate-binding protein
MAGIHTRRRVLQTGATVGAGLGLGAIGLPAILRGQTIPKVNYVTLSTGFSVIVNEYMGAKRFDLKNQVDLSVTNSYTSVANYYNDFAAGTFDLAIGSWDTYAEMYRRGVPIKLVCTATTAHLINIVAAKDGPTELSGLKGKTMAATLASGSYKLSKMVIKDFWGIELEKDVTVENVPSPAQSITLVMADRAAAGLSWEPNISVGLARVPGMKAIFNLGAAYRERTGQELPFFTYAAHSSALKAAPDIAARIAKSFADCIAAIEADPSEAIALAAPKMKVDPAVLRLAFDSGRLKFDVKAMSQPSARKLITDAADYMHRNGGLPQSVDDGFFAA